MGIEEVSIEGKQQRVRRMAISAFLLFHLIAITFWAVPLSSPLVVAFRGLIRPYMIWSGLFQSWDMFAPAPQSVNAWVQAAVIMRDGQIHPWNFPRMEQLGYLERYHKERYRKFAENIPDRKYSAVWPDVAKHAARSFNNTANPPEIVMLIQYFAEITPGLKQLPSPDQGRAHIFFEYRLQPGDLR